MPGLLLLNNPILFSSQKRVWGRTQYTFDDELFQVLWYFFVFLRNDSEGQQHFFIYPENDLQVRYKISTYNFDQRTLLYLKK